MKNNVVLIVRDGWGINHNHKYNAVAQARTPNTDCLLKKYPNTILDPAGTAVGLPEGYQGSSEVGHLNMGAGRIVKQELTRVNEALEDGSLFKNHNFQKALSNCRAHNSCLHLIGLVQDEGVHAHQDHLFAIMKYAEREGLKDLCIHFFSDGRDTAPRSASGFLKILNDKIKELGLGRIGTLMGRYYAMDRGENWALTTRAYNTLTRAEGLRVNTAEEAVKRAYDNMRTPNGSQMFDEYIPASIIGDFSGIKDGDSVVHFNYRQDRAMQLTRAFIDDDYPGQRWKKVSICYAGLTRYYDTFPYNMLEPLDETRGMENLLGEVISRAGLRQLRIAETQKFRHVTSFFNGKRLDPFENEERLKVKSGYDPATFAEHPEMNAAEVRDEVVGQIALEKFDFIVLNFANGDMVGHTGVYEAAIKAIEMVDGCLGRVIEATLAHGGLALVTADHGNAEEMVDYKTGLVKTAHTTNPVEFIYVADDYQTRQLRPRGILADIAPTILHLLGLTKPADMTAQNLIIT